MCPGLRSLMGACVTEAPRKYSKTQPKTNTRNKVLTTLGIQTDEYLERGGGGVVEHAVDGQTRRRGLRERGSGHNLVPHATHPAEHGVLMRVKPNKRDLFCAGSTSSSRMVHEPFSSLCSRANLRE